MVVRHLKYTIASTSENQRVSYINLARDLSAMNRQLFRQSRTYKIKSITLIDDNQAKYVQFGFAGDTWAMRNAVKRAYARWNEMNNQVLDDQPGLKARWNDFKPYLSAGHWSTAQGTVPGNVIEVPEDINGNNLRLGEWAHSVFESPDSTSSTDGYEVGILGNHIGSAGAFDYVGLIQSYGDARGTVNRQEPSVDATAASNDPLVNLLDAGTAFDEIAENIIDEGNSPPYWVFNPSGDPGDTYVGGKDNLSGELMFGELNSSSVVGDGLQRLYNIEIPLGVFRIDHQMVSETPVSNNFTIIVEVAEGNYKGIHSESMV